MTIFYAYNTGRVIPRSGTRLTASPLVSSPFIDNADRVGAVRRHLRHFRRPPSQRRATGSDPRRISRILEIVCASSCGIDVHAAGAGDTTSTGFQALQSPNSIAEFQEEECASSGDSPLYRNVALDTELSGVKQQLMDDVYAAHNREFLHAYSSTPHTAMSRADYETAPYSVE
ncbi:hypothetical protein PR003_g29529 [Phytophthora rubi]|uniref:Uncharacterized protein n=1 Tax=Phytophthora rubi TaxID=129364 RepID=A0A6A3H9T8_9STRA|nr:hypothetical protein PR002_g28941 [Phytophthora rubi]KAE8966576.1 hypothetical protein PR001_g28363 [Phytophthora rubi]KAE9274710.1 hypothetical protein PR003_g29529 [Phytophthora rubi]